MKFFDRWFAKQSKKAWEAERINNERIYVTDSVKPISGRLVADNRIDAVGINMKLHVANGGYIIEFQRWDNAKDRHFNELHVINDSQNLGERLSEVIVQYIISNH